MTSGFTKSGSTITWFQPFSSSSAPAAPDATAAPYSLPVAARTRLDLEITGGTLTIVANGISPLAGAGPNPERDYVSERTQQQRSTGPPLRRPRI